MLARPREMSQALTAAEECLFPSNDTSHTPIPSGLPLRSKPIELLFDQNGVNTPLARYSDRIFHENFPSSTPGNHAKAQIPSKPALLQAEYLYPTLSSNERLRLTTLWYHIRGLHEDVTAMQKIHEKVAMLKILTGWEYAICGIVDSDHFERIAATGMPLAVMPRKESPCSHTVLQPSGSVLFLPDMSQDWRFECAPCVSKSGLGAYAGAPLRVRISDDQDVALGSLCVASVTANKHLSDDQLDLLSKFADMLTVDIVTASRQRRLMQQTQNDSLLKDAIARLHTSLDEASVIAMLEQVFPLAQISIVPVKHGVVQLQGRYLPHECRTQCWEDHDYINDFIHNQNHMQSKLATHPIRAIIGDILGFDRAVIVATNDISHIFDDTDTRFVTSCTLLLRSLAKKSLQEALLAREHFMRGVTHHLRTPIHGILGSAELLQQGLTEDDDKHAMLANVEMVKESGKELMRFVNSMIRYNHWFEPVSTTQSIMDLDTLESQILQDIPGAVMRAQVRHTCVYFERKLPQNVSLVLHDESLIIDCLQPLVLNALQHTAQGSIVITYSATPDFMTIIFDIQDTGQGIAPKDQQRIFDSYEKVDVDKEGSGLGLTLARKVAHSIGGTVTLVSSEPGRGFAFPCYLTWTSFACPKATTTIGPDLDALPKRFCVLGERTGHVLSFVRLLLAHGLEEVASSRDALAIITYNRNVDEYHTQLGRAGDAMATFSLVPNKADTSAAQASFPATLFFPCPFTSPRLLEILIAVNDVCRNQQPSAIIPTNLSTQDSKLSRLPHCLLVDDNPINLRILCVFCKRRSFSYCQAVDGLQAIEQYKHAAKEKPVALILLDLQMPNCDGIQACKSIREFEVQHNTPRAVIIIVTGQDTPKDRRDAASAGADDYFVKPLAMKKLDVAISRHLEKLSQIG
ncbi:hypothetical protein AMS68_004214 [Peltaster fructicola]|uniref:histidine kinase n=1 Tax=Peltaster fructicola TaxID=286661 RepID=A0A6H0XVB6_9PEZI|nr:hypothetical protein AMS68_004214 [Peltaster fructicola]